jgi:deoxyribodipyrimidine photolyase-related protein
MPSPLASPPAPTVWIFEDQLSHSLSSLAAAPKDAHILIIESDRHFRSVPFHKHRIAFLASAMRHFADELRAQGRQVHYYPFTPKNYRDALSALRHHLKTTRSSHLLITDPSEHHTRAWLETLPGQIPGLTLEFLPNNLFLTDRQEFAAWARPLKSPVMEHFYRKQRTKFNVLMDNGKPIGGGWNLDKLNRKPAPKNPASLIVPKLPFFDPDPVTQDVLKEVDRRFPHHPGDVKDFRLPVTRAQALTCLQDFLENRLPLFGDYEDISLTHHPFLYHSFLSPLLNAGLLTPMECIREAERCFTNRSPPSPPLNAVEGFIRQILGWREYVYGIYHTHMPDYRSRNARNASRPLPDLYWDGNTDMNCLHQTVKGLLNHAYTHHIQRLMILCNFATLAGISPQAVNDWFYAMYADSHDWVVTPNVIGMGMNSDGKANGGGGGGGMATKPYVSSAAYVNRMTDYCRGCKYNPDERVGEGACPFNYLFWTFLHHYRDLYASNPRMTMMLKNAQRIPPAEMKQMMQHRKTFLESLPSGTYDGGKASNPVSRK